MKQIGHVINLEEGKAIVDVRRVTACGDKCGSCGGECNVQPIRVKMKNTLNVEPGDYVEITANTKMIIKAAFIVYTIPLFSLIIGIWLGNFLISRMGLSYNELLSVLTGFIFLWITYLIIKKVDSKIGKKISQQFIMSNIL